MPVAKPVSSDARVIAHVDMDCFYVQVEQRRQPQLRGLPTAVVQYNSWKGGGLIAVSYEARKYGVKRSMRGDEAKGVCPEIQLVQVPVAREKADLSIYRNAGSEVVSILARKGRCERASIDEVYLDLTDAAESMLVEHPPESWDYIDDETLKSHILGLPKDESDAAEKVKSWLCRSDADHHDKLLACGVLIVAELRQQVLKETEFTCSAGIAHNKMLAKLAGGINKPAQQTVVPAASVQELLVPLPIKKMKQLGGKLGDSLQSDLGVNTVGDLLQFSIEKLQEHYGANTGTWLWNIARGISGEEVEGRILPKSHGSGKTFPGPRALRNIASVEHWLNELCAELSERLLADLEKNKRIAHTLTVHARASKSSETESHKKFPSKSCPLRYGTAKIQEDALSLFQAGLREYMGPYGAKTEKGEKSQWRITGLSVSASKIDVIPPGTSSILKFFSSQNPVSSPSTLQSSEAPLQEAAQLSALGHYIQSASSEATVAEEYVADGASSRIEEYQLKRKSVEDQDTTQELLDPGHWSQQKNMVEPLTNQPHCSYGSVTKKQPEQQRKKFKNGTSSILNFLKSSGHSSSSQKSESQILQDTSTLSASEPSADATDCVEIGTSSTNLSKDSDTIDTNGGSVRGNWDYNADEIDPAVVNELPVHIQEEIRQWMRPPMQTRTPKPSAGCCF
ncbi:hypothetical protein Drorol1_Dr00018287 [Drosera rotundifolia]